MIAQTEFQRAAASLSCGAEPEAPRRCDFAKVAVKFGILTQAQVDALSAADIQKFDRLTEEQVRELPAQFRDYCIRAKHAHEGLLLSWRCCVGQKVWVFRYGHLEEGEYRGIYRGTPIERAFGERGTAWQAVKIGPVVVRVWYQDICSDEQKALEVHAEILRKRLAEARAKLRRLKKAASK